MAGTLLFAVEGATAAIRGNLDLLGLMVLAFAVALGGGIIRDIFLAQIPNVLRADVYATAALAGSAVMVAALRLRTSPLLSAIIGGLVCFLLRVISVWQHWNLPRVNQP
jgi:uncharacterized membrane protein YeiH